MISRPLTPILVVVVVCLRFTTGWELQKELRRTRGQRQRQRRRQEDTSNVFNRNMMDTDSPTEFPTPWESSYTESPDPTPLPTEWSSFTNSPSQSPSLLRVSEYPSFPPSLQQEQNNATVSSLSPSANTNNSGEVYNLSAGELHNNISQTSWQSNSTPETQELVSRLGHSRAPNTAGNSSSSLTLPPFMAPTSAPNNNPCNSLRLEPFSVTVQGTVNSEGLHMPAYLLEEMRSTYPNLYEISVDRVIHQPAAVFEQTTTIVYYHLGNASFSCQNDNNNNPFTVDQTTFQQAQRSFLRDVRSLQSFLDSNPHTEPNLNVMDIRVGDGVLGEIDRTIAAIQAQENQQTQPGFEMTFVSSKEDDDNQKGMKARYIAIYAVVSVLVVVACIFLVSFLRERPPEPKVIKVATHEEMER